MDYHFAEVMNKKFGIMVFAALFISSGVLLLLKKQTPASSADALSLQIPAAPVAAEKTKVSAAVVSAAAVSKANSQSETAPEVSAYEAHLLKQGFVKDLENPRQMIRKEIRAGKAVTIKVNKEDEGFEPRDITPNDALEILEHKKNENPNEEMLSMHSPNLAADDASLILGKFRDEGNDLELVLAVRPPEAIESSGEFACLISPKLGLDFKPAVGKYIVRVDTQGYGVVKFNELISVRIMWSVDHKRVVHGQVLKIENGQFKIVYTFAAIEQNRISGIPLKYCK